jgi:alkylated DNA repair dioxygenase AlkB
VSQLSLFDAPAANFPVGLAYADDVIDAGEEAALLAAVEVLPFKPFEFRGYLGNRQVVSFGWKYDYSRRSIGQVDPIPGFLLPLRDKAAAFAGREAQTFEQVLINRYDPGAGVGWHRDKPAFDEVIGVSLLSPCRLRFRRANGAGWDRAEIAAQPRSAYLFSGEARSVWEHSVPPVTAPRYSVTFRSLA